MYTPYHQQPTPSQPTPSHPYPHTKVKLAYLEEVVFDEVVHGSRGGVHPEGVQVDVEEEEPEDKATAGKFGLVADTHADHQG